MVIGTKQKRACGYLRHYGVRFTRTELAAIAALFSGFVAVVLWFDWVDFYHRNFFDTGTIVFANNVARILFVPIFAWLIYVPGAGIASFIMMSSGEHAKLTMAERAVLGFGIGVGIWHVVMLILGVLGLYYRPVMFGLCLLVLVASASHFAKVAVIGWRVLAMRFAELRQGRASPQMIGATVISIFAALLLLRRGLYPGGGGDYYTHYFYYYLEVLKNHGLAPNNVWYHYYYSKGSGLAFLGMLLTDPEAPALATYSFVLFASLAIWSLAERMAPNSSWPTAGVLVYLLVYLLGFRGNGDGEFQKDHEAVAALVVLTTWALCMSSRGPSRPLYAMAVACAIAATIITQAVGISLGLFVGLLCVWSALRRQWDQMWGLGIVFAATATAALMVFVLSYLATGLATDQPLDPMLRFADFARLDRWGVIPQIITVAWIRDNYQALVAPFGWLAFKDLTQFMRLNSLWPFLTAPILTTIAIRALDTRFASKPKLSSDRTTSPTSFVAVTTARLGALLSFFAVIALFTGRAQSVSFNRLSTFFIPLIVMFGIAGSAWVSNRQFGRGDHWSIQKVLPVVLLAIVVIQWQATTRWTRRVPPEMANVIRFLSGQFSLAEAYRHAESPYAFGAINPGALAAARQVPPETPIWSTNVDSYCMVPGCLIESVVSFKMSGRLDEVLGGDPELAKRRLQEAGLNYFLFMKDYRIIDLLPFSRLFAPEMIGHHLGVKWSDGSTFLLTWIGPETRPIGSDFLDAYTHRLAEPDTLRWFRFDKLAEQIVAISPRMRNITQWGTAANDIFTWR